MQDIIVGTTIYSDGGLHKDHNFMIL